MTVSVKTEVEDVWNVIINVGGMLRNLLCCMTRTHEEKLCIQSGVSGNFCALHQSFVRITFLSIFYYMECVSVAVFFS